MYSARNVQKDKIPFAARRVVVLLEQVDGLLLIEKNSLKKQEKILLRSISLFYCFVVFGGFTSIVSVGNSGTVYPPESMDALGKAFLRSLHSDFFTAV